MRRVLPAIIVLALVHYAVGVSASAEGSTPRRSVVRVYPDWRTDPKAYVAVTVPLEGLDVKPDAVRREYARSEAGAEAESALGTERQRGDSRRHAGGPAGSDCDRRDEGPGLRPAFPTRHVESPAGPDPSCAAEAVSVPRHRGPAARERRGGRADRTERVQSHGREAAGLDCRCAARCRGAIIAAAPVVLVAEPLRFLRDAPGLRPGNRDAPVRGRRSAASRVRGGRPAQGPVVRLPGRPGPPDGRRLGRDDHLRLVGTGANDRARSDPPG